MSEILHEMPTMTDLIAPLVRCDGFSDTVLPQVRLVASKHRIERSPILYEPSLMFIAQGRKIGYLGDREIHYNPGHYLVQTLPLPFECITYATEDEPLYGLSVRIDPAVLGELVLETGIDHELVAKETPQPMASVTMTPGMHEAVIRLLRALHDPLDAKVMGGARIRELVFEALKGEQGPALRALILNQGHYSRIVQVLTQMHTDLTGDISVGGLARQVNMSVSTFHHHFREVTRSSPLQYLKRLRLIKARLLLSHDELNVNQTAHAVGYQSVPQFSRDYKRYFGTSPVKHRNHEPAQLDS